MYITAAKGTEFNITDTKLYVAIVTLSTKNKIKIDKTIKRYI